MIKSSIFPEKKFIHMFSGSKDNIHISDHWNLSDCIFMNQIHSATVLDVKKGNNKGYLCDGLVADKGIMLGVRTADCMSILLGDVKKGIVAAVHSGWKGTYHSIISGAVKKMTERGSLLKNLRIAIGPHIRQCCYRIEKNRSELFMKKYGENVIRKKGTQYFLSMVEAVKISMNFLGIESFQVDDLGVCTFCSGDYFSFRRDKKNPKRNYSVIMSL